MIMTDSAFDDDEREFPHFLRVPVEIQQQIWDLSSVYILRHAIETHYDRAHSVALSPDGKLVAYEWRESKTVLGQLRIKDIAIGKLVQTITLPDVGDHIFAIAFSPNNQKIAHGCENGISGLWDIETGALLQRFELPTTRAIYSISISPTDEKIVFGVWSEGKAFVCDMAGALLEILDGNYPYAAGTAFSSDGKPEIKRMVGSAGVLEEQEIGTIVSANTSPDLSLSVTLSGYGMLTFLEGFAFSPGLRHVFGVSEWVDYVSSVAVSLDDRLVALGTQINGRVEVWEKLSRSTTRW